MYHNIGYPSKGDALWSLYVTPRMFRFQMWYMKVAGFRVVSLDEVLRVIQEGDNGEKLVAITFDDGFQDYYDHAYPVLKSYNYPSTVFLVSDLIGKENIWDRERGVPREKLLDWDNIMEMKAGGVTFGSHTRTHPFLTKLSDQDMEEEISGSKKILEQRTGTAVDFFCYPYGDYNAKVASAVRKAGYKGAVTTIRGMNYHGDAPFEMRRSFIRLNTHPPLFMIKLHTAYEDRKGARK